MTENGFVELILGGARSGKSALAENLARTDGRGVTYIATAEVRDGEMATRIAHHRNRRPPEWALTEAPLSLAAALAECAAADRVLLVDCLTLWLSNLLTAGDTVLGDERRALLDILPYLPGRVLLVSNEVGLGIVPDNAAARRFRDEAGVLHQAVAQHVVRVTFTVAGIPQVLKGPALTAIEGGSAHDEA